MIYVRLGGFASSAARDRAAYQGGFMMIYFPRRVTFKSFYWPRQRRGKTHVFSPVSAPEDLFHRRSAHSADTQWCEGYPLLYRASVNGAVTRRARWETACMCKYCTYCALFLMWLGGAGSPGLVLGLRPCFYCMTMDGTLVCRLAFFTQSPKARGPEEFGNPNFTEACLS